MRRYVLIAATAGLLLLAAAGAVWIRGGRRPPTRDGSALGGTTRAARFQPGLIVRGSSEEDEEYEGRAGANPRWPGAGRHPQWRGCRHTYQPALTAWIFAAGGSADGAAASPSG
jgi:hypothetical protein